MLVFVFVCCTTFMFDGFGDCTAAALLLLWFVSVSAGVPYCALPDAFIVIAIVYYSMAAWMDLLSSLAALSVEYRMSWRMSRRMSRTLS